MKDYKKLLMQIIYVHEEDPYEILEEMTNYLSNDDIKQIANDTLNIDLDEFEGFPNYDESRKIRLGRRIARLEKLMRRRFK